MRREACVVSGSDDPDDRSLPVGWQGSLLLLAITLTSTAQRDLSAQERRVPVQDLRIPPLYGYIGARSVK